MMTCKPVCKCSAMQKKKVTCYWKHGYLHNLLQTHKGIGNEHKSGDHSKATKPLRDRLETGVEQEP